MESKFGLSLRRAFDKLTKSSTISETEINEFKKDIQRALISSDVNIQNVMQISKKIEEKAREKIAQGFTKKEHLTKATYDILVEFLGGDKSKEKLPQGKILLLGLFGAGKTTSIGKLAKMYSKRNIKVGVIGADVWRPAAYDQLKQNMRGLPVQIYGNPKEKDPVKIIKNGIKEIGEVEVLFVDSAGRSGLDDKLITEIKAIDKALTPDETWLVMSADMGQSAGKQAEAFHQAVGVTGVIITKMEGSAKGGGALSACAKTGAPVLFIGTGEKLDDIEFFDPTRYLSRIMGYGDLEGLLEKAKEVAKEEAITPEQMLERDFDLEVFYSQLKATRKMGRLDKVLGMMGAGPDIPKEALEGGEEMLGKFGHILSSMTKYERKHPDILTKSRIVRIAKGSGTKETDVRTLLKNFKKTKQLFKGFKSGKIKRQLKQMKKMGMQIPNLDKLEQMGA